MLFTHDCTSFINSISDISSNIGVQSYPNLGYFRSAETKSDHNDGTGTHEIMDGRDWGYECNSIVRNIVGMYNQLNNNHHQL